MSDFRVGAWAKVIVEGDDHFGQVGKIVEAVGDEDPDGFAYYLDFAGDADLYAFRVNELRAAKNPRMKRRTAAIPDASNPGKRSTATDLADEIANEDASGVVQGRGSAPQRARTKWILGGVAVAALIAVAGAVITSLARTESPPSSAEQRTAAGGNAGGAAPGGLRGSLDDWRSAVCTPGSNQPNDQFPNSVQGGSCQAGRTYVAIARFNSAYLMRDDLARTNQTYYWGTDTDGTIIVFSPISYDPSALKPLTAYGFEPTTP